LKVILEAKDKLAEFEDLTMMTKRYTDNLTQKIDNLPSESEVQINDNKEKKNGGISKAEIDKSKKKHSKEKKDTKEIKKKVIK
jgi:hypothetical protein